MIHIRNDKDYSEIFEHIKNQVYSSDIDISSLTKIDPYQLLIIAEYALLQRKHKTESTLYCNRANRIIVNKSGLAKYISNEYKIESRIQFPVKKNILSEFHSEYSDAPNHRQPECVTNWVGSHQISAKRH